LRERLTKAGNALADSPLLAPHGICLPPDSDIVISQNLLSMRTPIIEICFRVELSGGTWYREPGTEVVPQLADGEARFETRPVSFAVETTQFRLRSQHRDGERYKEWTARVTAGAREWFEGY
jgi:hypothetical protein